MKLYAILGGIIAILGLFSGGLYFAYNSGKDAERARMAAQIEEYRDNQRLLTEKLAKVRARERVVVKTKTRTIRVAEDATGCADTDIPDDIYQQLQ